MRAINAFRAAGPHAADTTSGSASSASVSFSCLTNPSLATLRAGRSEGIGLGGTGALWTREYAA